MCVSPTWIFFVPVAIIANDITTEAGLGSVCDEDPHHSLFTYSVWASVLFLYTFHEIINFILVATITRKLLSAAIKRQKISTVLEHEGTGSMKKEVNTTITMYTVALVKVILFLPMVFLEYYYHVYAMAHIDYEHLAESEIREKVDYVSDVANWHRILREAIALAHATNFFVYLLRIRSFRAKFLSVFCFCFKIKTSE